LLALLVAAAAVLLVEHDVFQGQAASTARPDLEQILDGAVTGPGRLAPGATAYVSGPRGGWLGSAGLSDVETREAMEPDARMRLESVSKILTATLILQLAQDGRLELEDTVERWLPGLLPYGSRITVRQLLTNTSGLINNSDLVQAQGRYLARVKDSQLRAKLLELGRRITANPDGEVSPIWWIRWAAWQPLLFEPGSGFHYSNIGYEVLGLIAARAGRATLADLYREHIFEPLRLTSTAYDPQGPIVGRHAHGYSVAPDGTLTDTTSRHAAIGAGGGIVSNAAETARFLTRLMQGGLLDAAWREAMRGPALWAGGEETGCGGRAFGWSGAAAGFKTNVWVNRDGSRVAVLLLNGRGDEEADREAGATMQRLYCAG
jgi:D-alanyl-D-alanine carboxypeptidase